MAVVTKENSQERYNEICDEIVLFTRMQDNAKDKQLLRSLFVTLADLKEEKETYFKGYKYTGEGSYNERKF